LLIRRWYVLQGVPNDATEREVSHIFRPFPGFVNARLISKKTREGRKFFFCFVDFENKKQASIVLHTLQGYKFHNKDPSGVRISFATPTNQIKTGFGGKGNIICERYLFKGGRKEFSRRDSVGESGFSKKHSHGFKQFSGKYGRNSSHKRGNDGHKRDNPDESFGNRYNQYGKKQYKGFERRSRKERRF
jgi:RNA recognition motif-containing protein